MILKTKHFEEVEIEDGNIITFEEGIPGFENLFKYVVIENSDQEVPFKWLQSIDDPDLAFIIIDPFAFKKDYEFDMPDSAIEKLQIKSKEEINVYAMVVVSKEIKDISANLSAPIVINLSNKKGKQVLLDDDRYSTKHYILEELKKFEN